VSRPIRLRQASSGAFALLLLIAGVTSPPFAGRVSAHGPDPMLSSKLFGQDQAVSFRWRTGSEPPSAIKTAVKAAAAGIAASRRSRAATFPYASAGGSLIGYGAGATCGVNGIACFTRSAPTSFTMWLREQGRVFDWGTLRWCQMYTTAPTGCYDAETIALDEFGHVEGLGHHLNFGDDTDYLDAVVQTYSRTKAKSGWNEHALGRCDVATLQREYDVPSSATGISTCLHLDTIATLGATATAVVYGGTVGFTAGLRIAGDADYGRLANNALSGRTVKLQQRAVGTTTWSTVATMTVGTASGTYVASVKLLSSSEFRALYSASSTEGLNGDASPVLSVLVASCAGAPCLLPSPR